MTTLVRHVTEWIEGAVGLAKNTVDGLKFGRPNMPVTGIAVAFTASQSVVEAALRAGANLLISHEGEFYAHRDRLDMVECDPVVLEKRGLIEQSGLAVYRCHDALHYRQPDEIIQGLVRRLGWEAYLREDLQVAVILEMPETTVGELAEHAKRALGLPYLRVTGDLMMKCTRIGLSAGYRGGGELCIPMFREHDLDLIITGEGPEWETPEYVRDAMHQGRKKALILLGHAESEQPGMQLLAESLKRAFPATPAQFIAEEPVFRIV